MGHPRDNSPEAMEEFFKSKVDPFGYKHDDHTKRAQTYAQLITQHNDGKFVDRLLDVGCGEGTLTYILSDAAQFTMGIDISRTAIKRAEDSYGDMPDIDFKCIDFMKAGAKKKFDVLVMTAVLPYFTERWEACLKRIDRLVRKGGLVLVSFVSAGCVTDPWVGLMGDKLERIDTREFTCKENPHRAHLFKKK